MKKQDFIYFQALLNYYFGVTCTSAVYCRMSFPAVDTFTKYYEGQTSKKKTDYPYRKKCKACEPLYDNAICATFEHVEQASKITRRVKTDVKQIQSTVFFILHDIPVHQVRHYGFDLNKAYRFPSWRNIQRYSEKVYEELDANLPSTRSRMDHYQAKSYIRFKKRTHYQYLGVLALNLYFILNI